jgi:hypothetical protein
MVQRFKLKRSDIINIIRLRVGHTAVNETLHRFRLYFTPLCLNCTLGVTESIQHILKECPHYKFARTTCFKKIKMLKIYDTLEKCISILASQDLEIYEEVSVF